MFRRLPDDQRPVLRLSFDGRTIEARQGDSVAVALLANGIDVFRATPVSAAPRGPWCLMGSCFDCLVNVDGVANRQACLVEVREGMTVCAQRGRRDIA